MAGFSELIKNFDRTRDYVREFFIYGFKVRGDFDRKSARSYDDEKRRVESWLGEYLRYDTTSRGKQVAITLNSSRISENPLYRALESRSFTDNDIRLHFLLLDLLADGTAHAPVKSIFMGILAGDDLRLSEIARVADGFRSAFGRSASFQLGTVNDEATFSGRLAVAVLVFEESAIAKSTKESRKAARASAKNRKNAEAALAAADRFLDSEKTIWHNEDLDIPTYLRRNLTLDR